ncbi:hypothetical protein PAEH1_01480 [Paenalcaligenes hominis]|uniref:HK97 gp10 family phage protein n=1 Tax=Paenalcaligenes hominis TaxID=643674 RepID=A0A1U9JXM7_9BURK|nr:hypothetical protein [Paenalcaligenes hominis]AQS50550.1 hypothetical protein PAEH1_01480 [Paenalcaligenes hominis]
MAGWSKKPTMFIKAIEGDLSKKRNSVAVDMLQGVITSAPVQDGVFKANNRVSIDGPDLTQDMNEQDKNGSETLRKGVAVINANNEPFSEVFIQNNLPYAEALENGHSSQAPHGVYGVTFDAVAEKHK